MVIKHHVVGCLVKLVISLLLLGLSYKDSFVLRLIRHRQIHTRTDEQRSDTGCYIEYRPHPDRLCLRLSLRQCLHNLIGQLIEITFRNQKWIPLPYSLFYVLLFVHRIYDVKIYKRFNRVI